MALETVQEDERRAQIAHLLEQAREAHQQYETVILKHPDSNRSRWLAGFAIDRSLGKLLPGNITEDRLAGLLRQYDQEYQANSGQEPEAEYYARRLLVDAG